MTWNQANVNCRHQRRARKRGPLSFLQRLMLIDTGSHTNHIALAWITDSINGESNDEKLADHGCFERARARTNRALAGARRRCGGDAAQIRRA
ncbi:hypothetical protein PUN4_410111 [Paraburkholderia unamae]|nr:hypothetical protein PUN4_410111 [Paraburkholderia unamae]